MLRKNLVLSLIFACVLIFFACSSKTPGESGKTTESEAAPGAAAPGGGASANQLVIFSWWTAGGEADGLNELITMFSKQNPGIKIVNAAVAGGAGTNAKAVLKTRMLGGDPPDTFQVHGGSELIDTWVKSNFMKPITALYDKNGWRAKFPAQLIDMVSYKGEIYAVPSNVHRGNVLWYNKAVMEKAGVPPPKSLEDLYAACAKLKAAGVTPLAIGSREKWPVLHLFENLLLAAGGADFYRELFAGKTAWTDSRVKDALNSLKRLLPYFNADHSALTWDQASGLVKQGKAAMNVMGDWARGYFLSQGWEAGVDYGGVPTPGTGGHFFVVTDTFGMPVKGPNPEVAQKLLEIIGSTEGQFAFNMKKGSIPARTDVPMETFDAIAKETMADFQKDVLVPSAAHGSAVGEAFVVALNDQLSVFLSDPSVEKTANALEADAKDAGLRK